MMSFLAMNLAEKIYILIMKGCKKVFLTDCFMTTCGAAKFTNWGTSEAS